MALRQLIVAIEGTAAIGPFWQTIVSDYLDKIIRCFCGNESTGQKPSTSQVELSLVMFNTDGSYSGFIVQRSGWTGDIDVFFQWLSALQFAGSGFDDAAIAEGLAEALMMFSPQNEKQNPNVDGQRHCILVAASNPYPLPTPVHRPQFHNLERSNNTEAQPDNCLSDAEALTKSFPQCAISLSVICPKNLPKLREIYNAGKRNPQAADLPVDNVKNPHFLVLISDDFMEACAALSRTGMFNLPSNQNPAKLGMMPVPPISAPPSASLPSANGSVLSRQAMSAGENSPPAIVKVEPTTLTSALGPAFPHMSTVPEATSQVVPNLQASSPISTTQDTIPNNEIVQDVKPSTITSLSPVGGAAAANVRILNDVAQLRQALASGTSIGLPSMGGTHVLSNMIAPGTASSVPPAQTVISSGSLGLASVVGSLPIPATSQVGSASFTSTASTVTSLIISQSLNNLQVNVSTSTPGMDQGNLTDPPMVRTGVSMNPNMVSGTGISGMQMRPGMQPVGVNSINSVINVPLNQQTPSTMLSAAQSKYVKIWEGNLSGQRQGQPVFITRLEAYRSASASEALAATWPPMMQIVRLISQDHMNNKQHVGKAEFLVFHAMDQHGFLGQLQEKKLDMVVFKPQMPSQQLQAQQQQHPQQLQQQQQSQQQLPQLQQQPPLHSFSDNSRLCSFSSSLNNCNNSHYNRW